MCDFLGLNYDWYDVVGTEVSVSLDAKTHLVVVAYELGGDDTVEPEATAADRLENELPESQPSTGRGFGSRTLR